MFKVKCILLAAGLLMVGASQLYLAGYRDGIASIDQEAFDAYVHFAKPIQAAAKEAAHKPLKAARSAAQSVKVAAPAGSVFAVLEGK